MPDNWLVTGGCGFIGSALVARLAGQGCRIRVVDDLSVGRPDALSGAGGHRVHPDELTEDWRQLELVVADVRDARSAKAATKGADVVVHLAANTGVAPSVEDPRRDCEINVLGTFNYLEAARLQGAARFVFASSGAPLGAVEPPMHEDKPARPLSPYGASKLAGEGYCSAYWGSFGLETVALRFGNVYGPGSGHKQSVVAKFLRRALRGAVLEIYGDGSQTRDFIFIEDIVEAIVLAGSVPGIGGEIFQIATSRERTVNEIGAMIADLVERRTGRVVAVSHGDALPFEVKRNFSDTSKARRLLGFEPATEFAEGLERTLDSFMEPTSRSA